MLKKKEAIIVGAGLAGATIANILAKKNYKITVYEKNNFIGGNCFDYYKKNILIHKYGPHIFHTNKKEIYDFVCKYAKLNNFINKVYVRHKNLLFPLPINFTSIKIIAKDDADYIIQKLRKKFGKTKLITLSQIKQINDAKIKKFYRFIFQNVYANYTAKMWGVKFDKVNPKTINRVKIILGNEHNYFPQDKYQGLPINTYTQMITKMLEHKNIKINLKTDGKKILKFDFKNKKIYLNKTKFNGLIFYCGSLDELANYKFGILPYRSLKIEFLFKKIKKFQQSAIINYPSHPRMTRICEYKLMTQQKNIDNTIISKEYPKPFILLNKRCNHRFYPIINKKNLVKYNRYLRLFKIFPNFYPLGRLGLYKYFDMDDTIEYAMKLANSFC